MPNGFIPDEGSAVMLKRLVNPIGAGAETWRAVFWVNNITPDNTVTLAELVQASWPGYSFVTLDPNLWTAPVVTAKCATSNYGTTSLSWNVTGATTQTNYGYALIAPAFGVIRWIQRFEPADIKPLASGDQVTLLPQFSLTSAPCPSMMSLGRARQLKLGVHNARRKHPPTVSG